MKQLHGIYGAGGFGRECLALVRSAGSQAVFIDDELAGRQSNGCEILDFEAFMRLSADVKRIAIAIAHPATRARLAAFVAQHNIQPLSIRAQQAVILDEALIGEGDILCPFAIISSNARIGRYFHANMHCYVAHDCIIGDFVTFAPGVICNGNVLIEDHAYIGAGAILKQGGPGKPLIIGSGAVVGMGAVVTKDVLPGETVIGNPARPLTRR
jgi:sugar O-acyltransferase (sialic acid O-acetyltransferase NeuD family)